MVIFDILDIYLFFCQNPMSKMSKMSKKINEIYVFFIEIKDLN